MRAGHVENMQKKRALSAPTKRHRHQFYLDPVLTRKLDHYAREKRASKSALMTQALDVLFRQLESADAEAVFMGRLDRLLRHATTTDAKIDALTELVCVLTKFVAMTTIEARINDETIHQRADKRYQQLLEIVQRRILYGERSLKVPKPKKTPVADNDERQEAV